MEIHVINNASILDIDSSANLKHVIVTSKLQHQYIFTEATCTFDQNKVCATTHNMLTNMILS